MIHFQSNNKQQVVTDGNPYPCEDCILGRPMERFDVQVMFDQFEERLIVQRSRYSSAMVIASSVKSFVRMQYISLSYSVLSYI